MCNDPALPFCDTQGTLGGAVNECIAVACTPGEFAECRGDVSVVCNETRDNYELIECVRGCDDATGGCHIDPSNDLGRYLDMVQDPPDLGSPARKSGKRNARPAAGWLQRLSIRGFAGPRWFRRSHHRDRPTTLKSAS